MHPALLRRTLFPARRRVLTEKVNLHQSLHNRQDIERLQLERFNAQWAYCLAEVPFYRRWQAEHRLPQRLSHISELQGFPWLRKEDLVRRHNEVFRDWSVTKAYSTGGSTGTPVRYPKGRQDTAALYANAYLGRSWWGVEPFDACVSLWGHAHLFGFGLRGRAAQARRRAADHLLNITRLDAYDLTDRSLHSHYEAIRDSSAVFLVGYTSAVFRLARYVERNGLSWGTLRLRAAVLTAETVSDADVEVVGRVFQCPVVIEYGAAETGVIAYSHRATRPLRVLWDGFACLVDEGGSLSVSTLDRRLFPLINYSIGDVVRSADVRDGNALEFTEILGRKQDVLTFATATGMPVSLSAIMPVHILKGYPGIHSVQFQQQDDGCVSISLQGDRRLDLQDVEQYFLQNIHKDHPDVDAASTRWEQVEQHPATRSGKHVLVRREEG
jgi:phenylacetate-coenzyme A ligase PaaK-like adenylate-forming protein